MSAASSTTSKLVNTCVDASKLSNACLITLVYATCLSFTEGTDHPDIVSETALEVLQARGLTKVNPGVARMAEISGIQPAHPELHQVIDPEKIDEKTGDDLFVHIFDGCYGVDWDETPEGFIRRYVLGVDREGKMNLPWNPYP